MSEGTFSDVVARFQFQMMRRAVTTLLIFLSVCTHAAPYDDRTCIDVCAFTEYPGNIHMCRECSEYPPISHDLCYFACATKRLNESNFFYLSTICFKCFNLTHGRIMKNVCNKHCRMDTPKKSARLCGKCYVNGF